MRQPTRSSAVIVLLGLLASLFAVTTTAGVANAAPSTSTPPLRWGPVTIAPNYSNIVASPSGNVTVGCSQQGTGQDLTTYSPTGAVISHISRIAQIDGVSNCIGTVVVDKQGSVYGVPHGTLTGGGGSAFGPNLLAYSGNTLKWKYPISCTQDQPSQYAVGADGNIYATTWESDGLHLIGLTPNVAPGKTQPTKVVDAKIPNDCSIMLYPYKGGIMLHGQSSGGPLYYGYSGKFLEQTTGDIWNERMNADGRLFNYSLVARVGYHSLSVSAFNPGSSTTGWTTSVSTAGANAQSANLYPLSDGGVIAVVYEQRMANGIPVIPTTYGFTIVTLDASGSKIGAVLLDPTGTDGGNPTVVTSTTGKVFILRQLQQKTNASYPTSEPGIEIGTLNSAASAVTYSGVIQGNTDSTAGLLNGYILNYDGNTGPIIGSNALFIQVSCVGGCPNNDTSTKLYPVTETGTGLDYPRGTLLSAYPRPTAPYLALGDSFSSGEGNPPFTPDTWIGNVNTCHRTKGKVAYPERIAGTSKKIPSLGSSGFRACSGAVTSDLWDVEQWNEGVQIGPYPDTTTKLVTLTIGGNDIGFSDFGAACFWGTCQIGSPAYNKTLSAINHVLPGALKTAYEHVLRLAPKAQVYVMDYPQVVAPKSTKAGDDRRCPYLYDNSLFPPHPAHYPWEDDFAARDILTKLDAKIKAVIWQVRGENANYYARLHYVPVNAKGSPFIGHAICDTGASDFQNVNRALINNAYALHPNANGQAAYARLMANAINAG
jgi:hypothetical protein